MTDAESAMQALHALFQSLERVHVVYFMHMSAFTVFVYDHLTSFADEVEIVWPTAWHAGKVFFLIERYTTWPELLLTLYIELVDVSPKFCHNVVTYVSWSTMMAIVVTNAILILRTWALWSASRPVFISLSLLLLAIVAADVVVVEYYIRHTVFIRAAEAIPTLKGCVIASSTNRLGIAWILHTAFDLVIVLMTLIPGIKHFRSGRSNLITSLYSDGIWYFIYLFSVSLGNLMFIYKAPVREYVALFGPMQRSLNAILSCKIILHLQSATRVGGVATDTLSGTTSISMPLTTSYAGPSYPGRRASEYYGQRSAVKADRSFVHV